MWNFRETNFLSSSSNFTTSFSLFQIFYFSAIFFTSIVFFLFDFLFFYLLFPLPFLLVSLLLLLSFLLLFVFTILVFLALDFTAFYILSDTLPSLSLLFSSQSHNCNIQAIVFPKSLSTFSLLSHQSIFSLYASNNTYLSPLYAQ